MRADQDDGVSARQLLRVSEVEDTHWWFVGLRELIESTMRANVPEGGRVLDAGCGTGRVLAGLSPGYDRIGIDINDDAIRLARRRHPEMEFTSASVEAIPYPDRSFDAVLSINVLSVRGVTDPVAALEEFRRVLRPTGAVVLNVGAYEFLRSGHDVIAETARRYTISSLRADLLRAGLAPAFATYRVSVLLPVAAAWRLANKRRVTTDVRPTSRWINAFALATLRVENALITSGRRLPAGLSVFCIARPALAEEDR